MNADDLALFWHFHALALIQAPLKLSATVESGSAPIPLLERNIMAGKFEVYMDKSDQYRFRLKAGNGEIIATGQGYTSKDGVLKGIESVKRTAAEAAVVEVEV
ncbi:YegP family protein [Arthrobacter sp. KNU40]|uniref:YegP family protein n=1 Tax=Arthrobacter sp. KNU40 TaxID=3447965 RepID=UPI003F608C2D